MTVTVVTFDGDPRVCRCDVICGDDVIVRGVPRAGAAVGVTSARRISRRRGVKAADWLAVGQSVDEDDEDQSGHGCNQHCLTNLQPPSMIKPAAIHASFIDHST